MVVTRGGAGREPSHDAAVPVSSTEKKVNVVKITAGKRKYGRPKGRTTKPRAVREESATKEAADQEVADQLAAEQEAAMQAENGSSSSDDSIGIPPTPRQARDPYDVPATLRPSPEKRLAAQQAARKRSADEMDPGNSPSGAKRRRKVLGLGITSVAKGGKVATSAAKVVPGVLNALNQGARRLQGDQKPALVVELSRQKRPEAPQDVRGEAPTSAQPVPREEERQDHNVEDEPQAEVEDEPQEEEEAEVDVQPQESQDDEEELPGFQFEPPTPKAKAKTTRKTKHRKPKTAFEDRPSVTQAVPSPSESPTPPQRTESVDEDDDDDDTTSGHVRQLFQHDQPSPVRRPVSSPRPNIFDSSEDEDESEEDAGEGGPLTSGPAQHSGTGSKPAYGHLIEISVHRVRSLVSDMGLKDWTGLGKHWIQVMLDDTPFDEPDNPVVLQCCEELVALRREYSKAPRFPRLAKQDRFLRDKGQFTRTTTAKILAYVDELCRQLAEGQDKSKRETLESDVCEYIIPLLVLMLRHFCLLGGAIKDNRGQRQLPDKGTFTTPTTHLLAHVTRWLFRVFTSLSHNILTELEAWDEGQRSRMSQEKVNEGEKRVKLEKAVAEFRAAVQQALADLEHKRTEPIRRAQRKKREAEIRRKRKQEEQAEIELRQDRLDAVCRATQELRAKPDPMAERWHKAVAMDEKRAAERQLALSQARRPAQNASSAAYIGSPQLGGDMSAIRHRSINQGRVQPIPMRRQPSPVPPTRDWEKHEDDFLLEQLEDQNGNPVRPDQYNMWAGIIDRSVAEIKKEVEFLKTRARWSAIQKGRLIPAWAEKR